MGCGCGGGNYLSCEGDSRTSVFESGNLTEDGARTFRHTYSHEDTVTNLPISFLSKTERTFNVSHSFSRSAGGSPPYFVMGCDGQMEYCDEGYATSTRSHRTTVSENCVREINTPYYLDRQRGIFVCRYTKEELVFSKDSGQYAAFKEKWGTGYYNKICLPNNIRTQGQEKFLMYRNGVETILAETTYEYFPFPVNDVGGGIWGLYGQVIQGTEFDTPDVGLILIFPLPPKLSQPQDKDVLYYGFYDYNAVEGGFIENSLSRDDGGKDYFYPYWCRQMPLDKLWRATADQRYNVIYAHAPSVFGQYASDVVLDIGGTNPWSIDVPDVHSNPFGSFAVDSQDAFIYSCLCQFSDRAGGSGVVVNYASFGDLYKAIYTDNKLSTGQYNVFYPASPV